MPLEAYARGKVWWVKGRVEYNGLAITDYYRCSTGASAEAGAKDWIRAEEERQIRRHLVGEEKVTTFADAVMLYEAKPADAKFLLKVLPEIGALKLSEIYPELVRKLGPKIYPNAATDTWKRQIINPVSAVINNAHNHNLCGPIRIKGYNAHERIAQDQLRGKQSRRERQAGSWEWLLQFQSEASDHLSALAEFMFETGARISQAIALYPDDLDLNNCRIWMPASKGHPAQWVDISAAMTVTLANLPPKQPYSRKKGRYLKARVFGYADRSGVKTAWNSACKRAGIPRLTPHEAGRHGYYTELVVRQGSDPREVAKAGRWASTDTPEKVYAHSQVDQREIRERIRTGAVQLISEHRKKHK